MNKAITHKLIFFSTFLTILAFVNDIAFVEKFGD